MSKEALQRIINNCKSFNESREGLDYAITRIQQIAEEALHPYESAGVSAVWVKASERLPKVYGKITWRWLDKEAAYIGYVENRGFIYDTGGASVDPLYYNEIEWLDEGVGVKCAVWVKGVPDGKRPQYFSKVKGHLSDDIHYAVINQLPQRPDRWEACGRGLRITIPESHIIEYLDESRSLSPDQSGKEEAVMDWVFENRRTIVHMESASQLYDIYKQNK